MIYALTKMAVFSAFFVHIYKILSVISYLYLYIIFVIKKIVKNFKKIEKNLLTNKRGGSIMSRLSPKRAALILEN